MIMFSYFCFSYFILYLFTCIDSVHTWLHSSFRNRRRINIKESANVFTWKSVTNICHDRSIGQFAAAAAAAVMTLLKRDCISTIAPSVTLFPSNLYDTWFDRLLRQKSPHRRLTLLSNSCNSCNRLVLQCWIPCWIHDESMVGYCERQTSSTRMSPRAHW